MDLTDAQQKMQKVIGLVHDDLQTIRTGRATPALVENVVLSVYAGSQKLKLMELATISTADSRTIIITPFDPLIIEEINKGLQVANLGLTPVLDGELIRIVIPSLSEERRLEYVKLLKQKLEAARVMIRGIRHEQMNKIKETAVSEDDESRFEKDLQILTDKFVAEIEEMGRRKEEELLQI